MIVKMKFLQIRGPEDDLDRVCERYLSKYEIQLENALTELKTKENLQPFTLMNPYRDALGKVEQICARIPEETITRLADEAATAKYAGSTQTTAGTTNSGAQQKPFSTKQMLTSVQKTFEQFAVLKKQVEDLSREDGDMKERLRELEHFRSLDIDLAQFADYKFLRVRFGRMSLDYFKRLERYLAEDLKAVYFETGRTKKSVYGGYVTANKDRMKVDATFDSLHFEERKLEDFCTGTPEEVYQDLWSRQEELKEELDAARGELDGLVDKNASWLLAAKERLEKLSANYDIRKKAARTVGTVAGARSTAEAGEDAHYVLCGWMGAEDVDQLLSDTKKDDQVMVMVEEDEGTYFSEAPTKLKNPAFFKPFEMFIEMYGLPAANELDPTVFVALTYTFIFGIMFGDLGQGALLFLGGALLYKKKKMPLAGIISVAGIFSMIFGVLFGSVFGFEDVIPALWMRPKEAVTTLPVVGQLNTIFIIAVAFGMLLNLVVMVFQIINAKKAGDTEDLLFSHNGVAGMIFYGCLVATIVLYMTGHKTPGNALLAIFLGVPVLAFLFKEPLGSLIRKRRPKLGTSKVMFLVQGFFELVEIMLSYFSNTISYVRIGAFAVSHAAMMGVVLMLSGAESGHINWFGIIFGNLFVMLLEGLVVGIQVLRLEYYEMFSRYYKGSGRKFISSI